MRLRSVACLVLFVRRLSPIGDPIPSGARDWRSTPPEAEPARWRETGNLAAERLANHGGNPPLAAILGPARWQVNAMAG